MVQPPRRPTIHDVARRAGVSPSTVSQTYSGNRTVATDTRRRVREAAAELGYRPDPLAQGLRHSRLGVIALIARSLEDRVGRVSSVDYYLRLAGAAAMAAMGQGYGVMLVGDPTRPGAPSVALACDGVIITEPVERDELVTMLTAAGIPVVTIGDVPDDPRRWRPAGAPQSIDPRQVIGIDAARLTALVLDHLADAGARRIALINGTDRNDWCLTTEASYLSWVAARGQPELVCRVVEDRGAAGGRSAVDELFDAARRAGVEPPDGYYCLTGAQAVGAGERLRERGLAVPAAVKVVAGSDAEGCRAAAPPITVVDLEPEVLAHRAMATMLAILRSQEPPVHSARVGRLVVRDSTAPSR